MGIDNPIHLLFIAVVALVVLGPKRLPELTRALGHGIREFREAINAGATVPPQEPVVVQRQDATAPPAQGAGEGQPPGPPA